VFGSFAALAEFDRELISERTPPDWPPLAPEAAKAGWLYKMTQPNCAWPPHPWANPRPRSASCAQSLGSPGRRSSVRSHQPASFDPTGSNFLPTAPSHVITGQKRTGKSSKVKDKAKLKDRPAGGSENNPGIRAKLGLPELDGYGETRGMTGGGNLSADAARLANSRRHLIGTDTHDLPAWRPEGPMAPLEARHSLSAYLSHAHDWNPRKMDLGGFDRDAFWLQLMTGKKEGREYRALAEGSQSVTATGAGVLVPVEFAANVLELLGANLVFTNATADGSINGPRVIDMGSQLQYIPVWANDGSLTTQMLAENTQMTPTTASRGSRDAGVYYG
jgi:hypothetical protein